MPLFKSTKTTMDVSSFLKSVDILITKPHVVNKRLWGIKVLLQQIFDFKGYEYADALTYKTLEDPNKLDDYYMYLLNKMKSELCVTDNINRYEVDILLLELLPKNYSEKHAFQLIYIDKNKAMVTFHDVTPRKFEQKLCPDFSYTFQLKTGEVVLKTSIETCTESYLWLIETILPQFIKWGEESINTENNQCVKDSLTLVSKNDYYKKYNELKLKYGKKMVKIWPECTDPSKFVYEDVAIATYLLLLWDCENIQQDNPKKQTFVDLGCGNGLLVYILTEEGHEGVGLDVRKRQIWDIYPNNIRLEEKTIIPSDVHLFPEADWIIGNHSDELTPWIPVIAARSSYKCKFFLLPCCAYNFDGTKYQRKNSSKSQYTEYLEYIKNLCNLCGFQTNVDRLKIPSTKRVCLVSQCRTYQKQDFHKYCDFILDLVSKGNSISLENENKEVSWIKDFKPRDKVERVRNCTQIDKTLVDSIVVCITDYLLTACSAQSIWSNGKTAEIKELIQLVPQGMLKSLKAECGGIQTLLRNNHQIFKVQNGKVTIKHPKTTEEVMKESKSRQVKVKQKHCWFYNNHPQGCPLTDSSCSFLHVKN